MDLLVSNSFYSIPCMAAWYIYRDTEEHHEKETYGMNQGSVIFYQ